MNGLFANHFLKPGGNIKFRKKQNIWDILPTFEVCKKTYVQHLLHKNTTLKKYSIEKIQQQGLLPVLVPFYVRYRKERGDEVYLLFINFRNDVDRLILI